MERRLEVTQREREREREREEKKSGVDLNRTFVFVDVPNLSGVRRIATLRIFVELASALFHESRFSI